MRVRADHRRHPSVQMMPECLLFGCRLRVKIYDDYVRQVVQLIEQTIRRAERIVDRRHKNAALKVQDRQSRRPHFDHHLPPTRIPRRVIFWSEQPWLLLQNWKYFSFVPDVVPGSDHLETHLQELRYHLGSDPEPPGAILSVDDRHIGAGLGSYQPRQALCDLPARTSDDIGNEEDTQLGVRGQEL